MKIFFFNDTGKEITPEKDLAKEKKNVEDLPLPKEDDQMIENDEEDADQEQDQEQDEDENQEDEALIAYIYSGWPRKF